MTVRNIFIVLLLVANCFSEKEQNEELDLKTADLGEIDRALNNPLTFQNNTAINSPMKK